MSAVVVGELLILFSLIGDLVLSELEASDREAKR